MGSSVGAGRSARLLSANPRGLSLADDAESGVPAVGSAPAAP